MDYRYEYCHILFVAEFDPSMDVEHVHAVGFVRANRDASGRYPIAMIEDYDLAECVAAAEYKRLTDPRTLNEIRKHALLAYALEEDDAA